MTRYYKKYLPYIIFFSTVLVGTATILTASQLQNRSAEDEPVVPVGAEAGFEGGEKTCSADVNGHHYSLTVDVSVTSDPELPEIGSEGDIVDLLGGQSYTIDYEIKIVSFTRDGEEISRVECADVENDIFLKEKCEDLVDSDFPKNLERSGFKTIYNGAYFVYAESENFCGGGGPDDNPDYPYFFDHTCWDDSGWNSDRKFLEIGKGPITGRMIKKWGDIGGKACGTIQHDLQWAAFRPGTGKIDIDCDSLDLLVASGRSGRSCFPPPDPDPICGDSECNQDNETCDKDSVCEGAGFLDGGICRKTGADKCTYCGDGVKQASEACDPTAASDPNKDKCTNKCVLETAQVACGDDACGVGETCDNSQICAGDGFLSGGSCRASDPDKCTYCGDGIKQASEICDPTAPKNSRILCFDKCNDNCTYDKPEKVCGDGICKFGETCDGTLACPSGTILETGTVCRDPGELSECTYCGDGFTQFNVEECDSSNPLDPKKDKCTPDCEEIIVEDHPQIEIEKSHILRADRGERADDQIVYEGGKAVFVVVAKNTGNVTLTNIRITDPEAPGSNHFIGCEDTKSTLNSGEGIGYKCWVRVDRNSFSEDGDNDITIKGTYDGMDYTATDSSKVIIGYCGDGDVQVAHESCDDGNNTDGDGCSSTCEVENRPPACQVTSGSSLNLVAGDVGDIVVNVTDEDNDVVTLSTTINNDQDGPNGTLNAANYTADAPYNHTVKYVATKPGTDVVKFTVSDGEDSSECTANVGISEPPNNAPICETLTSIPKISGEMASATEFAFTCTGYDLDADPIESFAFKVMDKSDNNKVVMETICNMAEILPTVGICIEGIGCENLVCSGVTPSGGVNGGYKVTLSGYKFPYESDYTIKSKVKDSRGAWSSY